jgi:hypothetical protein
MQETVSVTLAFDVSGLGIHTSGTYANIDIDIDIDVDGDVISYDAQCAVDDFGRELELGKVVEYLGLDLTEAVEAEAQGIDLEGLFEDVLDESDLPESAPDENIEFGGVS